MTASHTTILRFEEAVVEVLDSDGQLWIPAKQTGYALGYADPRGFQKLVQEMRERDELREGKHFLFLPIMSAGGQRNTQVLSYRGVIRTAMRSDAPRAVQFRDWAEDVLFEVMVTGKYLGNHGQHWTEQLSPEDRLRLTELRVSLALRMLEDPNNPILHGAMAETYGGIGAVREFALMKGCDLEKTRKRKRRGRKTLDRDPEVKDFVVKLFREGKWTVREIEESAITEFGEARVPSKTTLSEFGRELRAQ